MKKFFAICFIFSMLLFCGFKQEEKPLVILSSNPIDSTSLKRVERFFPVGHRVNYALILPNGVKYSGIRIQFSKQDEKTTNWGYSIEEAYDIYIGKGEKSYRNYFVPKSKGHYIIQFFYLNKKNYPFIHKEFMVY